MGMNTSPNFDAKIPARIIHAAKIISWHLSIIDLPEASKAHLGLICCHFF